MSTTILRQVMETDPWRDQMSGQKVKQGYMKKFAKGIVGESWKKVFVEVYSDGLFCWYKKKKGSSRKGSVLLRNVCEYLTVGSYCRAIPFSPQLPSGGRLDYMIAFPEEPNKKSKIHFFLTDSEQEFSDWMSAITSTFPAAPPQQQQQPSVQQPVVGTGPYNAFSPTPSAPMAGPAMSSAPPLIGFEALSISSNPPPAYSSHSPSGYAMPQPQYVQPGYPPQQPYQQQPYVQQSYPQQPYPQQPYPQQPYPQQPYPQQPQASSFPRQQQPAVQHPYQQNPYGQQYPQYQTYGGPSYPGQPGQPYHAPSSHTTVIVRDHHRSRGPAMGNMATGILGGAVAGYAASRMFGGWGHGFGWGRGSWGSCSWGSGSWGSCSGGSWGSFGSFD